MKRHYCDGCGIEITPKQAQRSWIRLEGDDYEITIHLDYTTKRRDELKLLEPGADPEFCDTCKKATIASLLQDVDVRYIGLPDPPVATTS